jgi:hypothetical protein
VDIQNYAIVKTHKIHCTESSLMVVNACNPSIREAEVDDQELKVSVSYIKRL